MNVYEYERIAEELAAEISAGTWAPGSALPTIPELMDRFGCSRITVRAGLKELMSRGDVYTGFVEGRRGTIVRSKGVINHYATDALRPDRGRTTMDAFSEAAVKAGRKPGKQFAMRIAPGPPDVTNRLGLPDDELVVIRTVYQLLDGEPWSREDGYYPRDLASEAGLDTARDIPDGTIRALARAGYAETGHVDEVTVGTAGPKDADDLSVAIGTPLLFQTRTAATANRVTRVMRYVRIAQRQRLIWELGDAAALDMIRRSRGDQS